MIDSSFRNSCFPTIYMFIRYSINYPDFLISSKFSPSEFWHRIASNEEISFNVGDEISFKSDSESQFSDSHFY